MKHVFLTGDKGVGKTTLLRSLTDRLDGKPSGFYTVKTTAVFSRPAVHLVRPGESPAPENFLFFCGEPADPARFNFLGTEALNVPGDYIIMDELGPAENEAADFQQAVLAALNGDVPVYGVLQRAETAFLRQVANHPRVQLTEVTCPVVNGGRVFRDFPAK